MTTALAKNFPATAPQRPGTPALAPDAAGLFYEARVSEALGVSRKLLARLRAKHLVCGPVDDPADFVRLAANAVALTPRGLAKIESALAAGDDGKISSPRATARETTGKPPSSATPQAAEHTATAAPLAPAADIPAGPAPREVMTIERVPQNPNILLCLRTAPASLVAVRVRTNEFFVAGMKIECIQGGSVWQFRNRFPGHESQCGRLPRRKGVW